MENRLMLKHKQYNNNDKWVILDIVQYKSYDSAWPELTAS